MVIQPVDIGSSEGSGNNRKGQTASQVSKAMKKSDKGGSNSDKK